MNEHQERIARVTAKYGKPVVAVPHGISLSGRVAEVEASKEGKLLAVVVGEQLVHVIRLPEQALELVGKRVDITNEHGRLQVQEHRLDRGQEIGR